MPAKYVHTNLIAENWRALASFYEETFGCVPFRRNATSRENNLRQEPESAVRDCAEFICACPDSETKVLR